MLLVGNQTVQTILLSFISKRWELPLFSTIKNPSGRPTSSVRFLLYCKLICLASTIGSILTMRWFSLSLLQVVHSVMFLYRSYRCMENVASTTTLLRSLITNIESRSIAIWTLAQKNSVDGELLSTCRPAPAENIRYKELFISEFPLFLLPLLMKVYKAFSMLHYIIRM